MSAASFWNTLIWTHLAKPACERELYRRVRKLRPQRIVELGVGDLTRAQRLIAIAQRESGECRIEYCAVDAFEARTGSPRLKLKEAHRRLAGSAARIRLVPGELAPAVSRSVNLWINTDLMVIDAAHSQSDLERISGLLPRIFHPGSVIARFESTSTGTRLVWLDPRSISGQRRSAA